MPNNRYEALNKQLKLILQLAGDNQLTVDELSTFLDTSRRNFYYFLDFLREAGFVVFKQGHYYRIDPQSPFFEKLRSDRQFTDEELTLIYQLLCMIGDENGAVLKLRQKLEKIHNVSFNGINEQAKQIPALSRKLISAIKKHKMVKLVNYSSPSSHSVRDRIVEPFFMMNDNKEVRCYEPASDSNKTFKLMRIEKVEILNTSWQHEKRHKQIFTDIFMFSSEHQQHLKMRMGQLAYNLFMEEYPNGRRCVMKDTEPEKWILELDVCDFRGIGRFVMGLINDIEILENDSFKLFLIKEMRKGTNRILFE